MLRIGRCDALVLRFVAVVASVSRARWLQRWWDVSAGTSGRARLITIYRYEEAGSGGRLGPMSGRCGSSAVTSSHRPGAVNHDAIRLLPCRETAGADAPWQGTSVVLGVVALPASPHMRRALQTTLTGSRDPAARLFAKEGLVVRAGARFELMSQRACETGSPSAGETLARVTSARRFRCQAVGAGSGLTSQAATGSTAQCVRR